MNSFLPFQTHDPQSSGHQYLEDLATAYWYSETLFTAVELGIFSTLEETGKTAKDLAQLLKLDHSSLERFLQSLCALGLLVKYGGMYNNTFISNKFLTETKSSYLGDSILWRKQIQPNWRTLKRCLKKGGRVKIPQQDESQDQIVSRMREYSQAMATAAKRKLVEILPVLEHLGLTGELLDVGAGLGILSEGILQCFPEASATLMDIPEIVDFAEELFEETELRTRLSYAPVNILEPWPFDKKRFELIILSNVVHAYGDEDIERILGKAIACLKEDGLIMIHDLFREHYREKAALFDLNMFINTYSGKIFSAKWLKDTLEGHGLFVTEMVPLGSDTALLFGAKKEETFKKLCTDVCTQLVVAIRKEGFRSVQPLEVEDICIPGWADVRCRFGCGNYGKPHCPPNTLSPDATKDMLEDYSRALLLEGEPPTTNFQKKVLTAEREAFTAGYYKAFSFWAGPCSICPECRGKEVCCNPKDARPSMEGAGIDVFATVRKAGIDLHPLGGENAYAKYFAILLLE